MPWSKITLDGVKNAHGHGKNHAVRCKKMTARRTKTVELLDGKKDSILYENITENT